MPYDAAKALAKTFCYKIRYALVPLFGPNFPGECKHPNDDKFKDFKIDAAIITRCAHVLQQQLNAQSTAAQVASTAMWTLPHYRTDNYVRRIARITTSDTDEEIDITDESGVDMIPETPESTGTPARVHSPSPELDKPSEDGPPKWNRAGISTPEQFGTPVRVQSQSPELGELSEGANRKAKRVRVEEDDDEDEADGELVVGRPEKLPRGQGSYTQSEVQAAYRLVDLRYTTSP